MSCGSRIGESRTYSEQRMLDDEGQSGPRSGKGSPVSFACDVILRGFRQADDRPTGLSKFAEPASHVHAIGTSLKELRAHEHCGDR